jgi:hypothetical protein
LSESKFLNKRSDLFSDHLSALRAEVLMTNHQPVKLMLRVPCMVIDAATSHLLMSSIKRAISGDGKLLVSINILFEGEQRVAHIILFIQPT